MMMNVCDCSGYKLGLVTRQQVFENRSIYLFDIFELLVISSSSSREFLGHV